jgi:hypothetical protein
MTQLLTLFLRDILYELACVGDLPLPHPSPSSHKRDRDQVDSLTEESETVASRSRPSEEPRRIAGSRRVASKYALQSDQNMQVPQIPIQDPSTPSAVATSSQEFGNFQYSQSVTSTAMPPQNPELFPVTDVVDHPTYSPIVTESWPTGMNVGPSTDHLYYDQMAAIFSTPFGEMTDEELAMAILSASATQAVSNDEANAYQAPVDPK